MHSCFYRLVILACLLIFPPSSLPVSGAAKAGDLEDIRSPVMAGVWYPRKPELLRKTVKEYLSGAGPQILDGEVKALIVPHAGYRYSGGIAGRAYRALKGRRITRVVMIGPSHRVGFGGISVNLQAGYETPLGTVPVDMGTARKLLDEGPPFRWLRQAHASEHSLEVQLPFIQEVLGRVRIVPVIMGRQDFTTCSTLADTLVRVLGHCQDTLFLASTDLSHYHPYREARAMDGEFISHVAGLDARGLAEGLVKGRCEACGGGPVISAILAAGAMGADKAAILGYATSGDVNGDRRRVVGYLAAALVRTSGKGPHPR